jgi:hypothetical protein
LHRFVWDLHWPAPAALEGGYSIAAVPHDTPREPRGPWALPGRYTIRLTAAGRTLTRALSVRMDPRVKTSDAALARQLSLSMRLAEALDRDTQLVAEVRKLRKLHPEDAALAALEGKEEEPKPLTKEPEPALVPWNARLSAAYSLLQSTDEAPTPQAVRAVERLLQQSAELFARAEKALGTR